MSSPAAKRILLVDDSALLLDLGRSALEAAGYAVTAVSELGQLEGFGPDTPIDLVLMDVQMPELFGDDVAGVLRHVRGLAAPIYLFSSLDDAELAERARDAGLDGYLRKRDGMDALVERVRDILEPR